MSSFYTRQAIVTSYHGPTDRSGPRIIAKCDAGSVRCAYNYALSIADNHRAAAEALILKLGWSGNYAAGTLPDGRTAFVKVETDTSFSVP